METIPNIKLCYINYLLCNEFKSYGLIFKDSNVQEYVSIAITLSNLCAI